VLMHATHALALCKDLSNSSMQNEEAEWSNELP